MNYDKFLKSGRLVRDPEVKETKAGKVTIITIAINRKVGGEDHASFYDLEGWDKVGERMATFKKGQLGFFEGEGIQKEFPAKDKEGKEIFTDEGKRVVRRIDTYKVYNTRYLPEAPKGAGPGPVGEKGKAGPAGDEDDVPF